MPVVADYEAVFVERRIQRWLVVDRVRHHPGGEHGEFDLDLLDFAGQGVLGFENDVLVVRILGNLTDLAAVEPSPGISEEQGQDSEEFTEYGKISSIRPARMRFRFES